VSFTVRRDQTEEAKTDPGGGYPVHVVRQSETLRSIARDRLGNASRAAEIIELNRESLPESNQVTVGQHLILPPDARPLRRAG
jgi:hypothetical protein